MKQKIREKFHKIIEQIEDEKILKAVYIILGVTNPMYFELSEEQKVELDRRIERYKRGETKSYTWEEVKQKIRSGI